MAESKENKLNTKAAGIVGIAVMCSRVLGLIREQIFAWLFGGGKEMDAFTIAFRTPNGNHKWQSIARVKVAPAKDGDVVVTLAEPLAGGTEFFEISSAHKGKGMLGLGGGADMQFAFTVTIAKPDAYREEVIGLIKDAQTKLLALVKR